VPKMRVLIGILTVLAVVAVCRGRTITVDDDGPADFSTIQAGIDDSDDGDTVLVADGVYTGDGNRDIDFLGKAITVKSENGPETCVIDCNGTLYEQHRGFYFHTGEDTNSVLSGFTITNGASEKGGGISCDYASPTIEGNIISGNTAFPPNDVPGSGGGIRCSYSSAVLRNNVIANNYVVGGGGGIYAAASSLILANNLITGNHAYPYISTMFNPGTGGAIWGIRSSLTITNNTIVGNYAQNLGGAIACNDASLTIVNSILRSNQPHEISVYGTDMTDATYSNIQGGRIGEGNIDTDPCFAASGYWDDDSWINGDYYLKSQGGRWDANEGGWTTDDVTSPCIDAGDPMCAVGTEPFPNGGIVNMGVYGGTAEGSKSWFGGPACETIVAGDIDGNCLVDFRDFGLMSLHWLEDNRPCGDVTTTYVFEADPNALTTSGGFAGQGQGSRSIEGGFELTVDLAAGTAEFSRVDATLSGEVGFMADGFGGFIASDDLEELFRMTKLASTDVNDTAIDFVLERGDCGGCFPPSTDIHLRATFTEDSVHLVGNFCDPCCDLYCYHLDAVAVREP